MHGWGATHRLRDAGPRNDQNGRRYGRTCTRDDRRAVNHMTRMFQYGDSTWIAGHSMPSRSRRPLANSRNQSRANGRCTPTMQSQRSWKLSNAKAWRTLVSTRCVRKRLVAGGQYHFAVCILDVDRLSSTAARRTDLRGRRYRRELLGRARRSPAGPAARSCSRYRSTGRAGGRLGSADSGNVSQMRD